MCPLWEVPSVKFIYGYIFCLLADDLFFTSLPPSPLVPAIPEAVVTLNERGASVVETERGVYRSVANAGLMLIEVLWACIVNDGGPRGETGTSASFLASIYIKLGGDGLLGGISLIFMCMSSFLGKNTILVH